MREPNQLRHRCPQYISVDCRHAVHAPVLGMLLDQLIYVRSTIAGCTKQVFSKAVHFGLDFAAATPECRPNFLRRLLPHIRLKKHLQRQFA